MFELMLPTPGSTLEIPIILDVVDIKIPPLLELDVLGGNNLLVDNTTNHLWKLMATNKDPLRFQEIWKIKLIMKCDNLYLSLTAPI